MRLRYLKDFLNEWTEDSCLLEMVTFCIFSVWDTLAYRLRRQPFDGKFFNVTSAISSSSSAFLSVSNLTSDPNSLSSVKRAFFLVRSALI